MGAEDPGRADTPQRRAHQPSAYVRERDTQYSHESVDTVSRRIAADASTNRSFIMSVPESDPLSHPARPLDSKDSLVRRGSSLGSQIASGLREEIVLGRLRAGTRVSQERLCRQYGTSRMPVRDALLRLTQEGLVVVSPTGHYVVARLTTSDVADAFEIEALVHGRAARRATMNATEDDLDELEELCEEMAEAERVHDTSRVATLHWQFHRCINILARSPKLQAVTRNVSVGIPQAYLRELPEWMGRANDAHVMILTAMRDRDPDEAERLVRKLIEESGADLVAYLERNRLLETSSGHSRSVRKGKTEDSEVG